MNIPIYLIFLTFFTGLAGASDYAGQNSRTIKSLSSQDIEDLRHGRGWGLAKPAELNGLPGPIHLLELRSELALSQSQIDAIQTIYDEMNAEAREIGARYIRDERVVEEALLEPGANGEQLKTAVIAAANTRAALRLIHLEAHLQTPGLLSADQLEKYKELRGYSDQNLCDNPPAGHDAKMWRRHNNC